MTPLGENRFVAILALKGAAVLSGDQLVAVLRLNGAPDAALVSDTELTFRTPSLAVTVDGTMIAIMAFDTQAPGFDSQAPVPGHSLSQPLVHAAHLVVASARRHFDTPSATRAARAVAIVSGALCRLAGVAAVRWAGSDVFLTGKRIEDQLCQSEDVRGFHDLWVGLNWRRDLRLANGDRAQCVFTSGLSAFIGRELEIGPTTAPGPDLTRRLKGTIRYLLANGPVLNHGDQLALFPSESIRAVFADQGVFAAGPVIRLELERMVVSVA